MEQESPNTIISTQKKFSFPPVSVLGILVSVLLLTLISTVLWQFFQNKKISEGLKGVYVTDINDRSAVVSWVTSQPNKTELVYSKKEIKSLLNIFNSQIEYDRRDLEEIGEFEYRLNRRGKYFVHSVHLRNLTPQTEYHFAIRNGTFLNSAEYIDTFSTINEREEVDSPEVGYGNIYNQNGNLISDTLVFFELTNKDDSNKSQMVSYVMDGKTGWSVNISNLMSSELKEKYVKEKETYLGIYIINANGEINKIVSVDKIKPAENVSAYDNKIVEKNSEVKGVMAILCECKSCTPSCPSGYSSTYPTGWNYVTTKATCTSTDSCTREFCETITGGTCYQKTTPIVTCKQECESCTPECPSGYEFTCPQGWNCSETKSVCERYEKCTGEPCGTQSGSTCYKPTTQIKECVCNSCEPECPENFHFEACKEGFNCTTIQSSCSQVDTCGVRCGSYTTKGATCYKEGDPIPVQPPTYTKDSCVERWELDPIENRNQSFYWCDCPDPIPDACMGALDLYRDYESSCTVYCENSKEKPVVSYCEGDNLKDKSGNVVPCEFGCQDNGQTVDDICKPKPIDIPQEVNCSKYTDMSSCRWADSSCDWSFSEQKCSSSSVVNITSCSSISNQTTCNSRDNCEFVEGKCQEVNLNKYIRENTKNDYCTGLRDSKGNIIPIGYGTDSINTHSGLSKCSIDVSAMEVNLGNQIPGSTYNTATNNREWKDGYKCEVGEYQPNGYGYNVIITQPDGTKIKYAHLKYGDCNNIVTGNSGNQPYHLHVEVMCSTPEECATCQGDTNPCRAIAGGCFACSDTVRANAISGGDIKTEEILKSKSLFTLISKVRAAEMEYIDPAILIKDLELEEGTYSVKSASMSETTSFVKTDDTHIVFYEDVNENGKLDTNETLLSPYQTQVEYKVAFEKIADSFNLSLQEGLNLVSFPIVFKNGEEEEIKKVSELIGYLNKQGTEITTITAYRGGKFIPYVIREGKGFGEDFNILPGEGYFVLSHSSGDLSLSGIKVKDGLEVQLYEGWNLVNIYNSNIKSYSGFDVLKNMKEQSVGADIISKWEDGMYLSIVSEESGDYGNDFNIYQNRGYFIRVVENGGPFTPK